MWQKWKTKWTIKYVDDYRKVRAAQLNDLGPLPFEIERLGKDRPWSPILRRAFTLLVRAVFWFLRTFWPVARFGRVVVVARAVDADYVLKHPQSFEVPYGLEMAELAGAPFMLGIDGLEHKAQREMVERAVKRVEDTAFIAERTRTYALRMIGASGGRIDVMSDLITRVASDVCIDYLGLAVDDPDAFAEWTMSVSALMFADFFGDQATRRLALAGAARARAVVDRSIRIELSGRRGARDTLLGRLLRVRSQQAHNVSNLTIRSIMIGTATGLVPTNTVGAGKMLEELLRRPDAWEAAKQAARDAEQYERSGAGGENPHKKLLRAILLEAGRLNPALFPGQWRYVREDSVIGSKRIAKGSAVLIGTASALRDPVSVEDPGTFKYDRPDCKSDFMFGGGPHQCLGQRIAMVQITEIFQVLLSQTNLRVANDRWGRIRWTSAFPIRLDMEFDPASPATEQQMLTICAPLREDASKDGVRVLIEDLQGNPSFSKALETTGIVHFASLNVIEAGEGLESRPFVLLELNVDGARKAAIETIVASARSYLGPIFERTPLGADDLVATLSSYALDLQTRPCGATGLNFNGTPEFSVAEIELQEKLAVFARESVDYFITRRTGIGSRAMPALNFVRHLMRGDREAARGEIENELDWTVDTTDLDDLIKKGKKINGLADQLYLPGRKRLLVSDWVERTNEDALYHFLKSRDFWLPASPFIAFAVLMAVGICLWIGYRGLLSWPGQITVSVAGGMLTTVMLVLSLAVVFVLVLRWHERTDMPDDRDPTVDNIKAVTARENPPGFAQNHFMAVTRLKPGLFRKLTLALSLWGIKQLVRHAYRPGFVLNMGTIHYAKWFRLPGTEKLIFLANYDGSWESYLEDFVMKAHAGQTAAWSNGVGFPKTNLLIYEGAQDGDRFKRWVRRQQVATQFWFSRFPHLTTDQIRNNAIIRQGIARAHTESLARNWLACFGSMQRPDHAIESTEIQSLVFAGFKRSPCGIYALVRLPDRAQARAEWLESVLPKMLKHDQVPTSKERAGHTEEPSQLGRNGRDESLHITFGDHPYRVHKEISDLATFVAFSAAGLKKLGLSDEARSSFAGVFNIGMANRGRVLGDLHDPKRKWRWSDSICEDVPGAVDDRSVADAILIIYAPSIPACRKALDLHRKLLGGAFIEEIEAQPATNQNDDPHVFREHFGFRDGISQPVIRGTHRSSEHVNERDIVEPGEFILGYRNNQGYYPSAIHVGMETDLDNRLPDVISESPPTFPPYRIADAQARDFGRNGTFLVVRQIEQDVARFDSFIKQAAKDLTGTPSRGAAGTEITEEWVAAKMMGRWKSGAPLVLRPVPPREEALLWRRAPESGEGREAAPEAAKKLVEHGHPWDTANDFAYAHDDPQGLRCPFGAHIRRANPRDGLKLGDAAQQSITNRHRLLRRGRSYEIKPADNAKKPEKGMMFACLCADLERQFEFVQQTWIGSSSFHGLTDEVDPIIGAQNRVIDPKDQTRTPGGRFTIPTPSGPVTLKGLQSFVTVHAGGYFFMPSFSAMQYLWDLNREAARASSVAAFGPGDDATRVVDVHERERSPAK